MSDSKGLILVTGGARGIGAATARRAAAAGYSVAVNYRQRADAAAAVVADIAAHGGRAVAVQADIADEEAVARMFAGLDPDLGPLVGLVNNAGTEGNKSAVADFDSQVLRRMFEVNVLGVMLCCREAVRRMSTRLGGQGGAIVNVSSMAAAIGGRAGASDYAAAKAAVDCFTVGLAKEVAAEGIRVNTVRPGMTLTDMLAAFAGDKARFAKMTATVPMQRAADPDEIAAPIAWLLSEEASFISGACLDASGGGFLVGDPLKH